MPLRRFGSVFTCWGFFKTWNWGSSVFQVRAATITLWFSASEPDVPYSVPNWAYACWFLLLDWTGRNRFKWVRLILMEAWLSSSNPMNFPFCRACLPHTFREGFCFFQESVFSHVEVLWPWIWAERSCHCCLVPRWRNLAWAHRTWHIPMARQRDHRGEMCSHRRSSLITLWVWSGFSRKLFLVVTVRAIVPEAVQVAFFISAG